MKESGTSLKKTARFAGVLYLLLAITGAYSMMYVASQIMVRGNAAATANNILANELLFRSGIVGQLISQTLFVFLVLALYRLFKETDKRQAQLMVALVLVSVPIAFILEVFNGMSLLILKNEVLTTLDLMQKQEMAMLFLKMNRYGTIIIEVFWGLWLIPFGQLVIKSGFIPRILGWLLIIAGVGYVLESGIALLFPEYRASVNQITSVLTAAGEFSIILWLLIIGAKDKTIPLEFKLQVRKL